MLTQFFGSIFTIHPIFLSPTIYAGEIRRRRTTYGFGDQQLKFFLSPTIYAGETGIEPATYGFGDRRSTS